MNKTLSWVIVATLILSPVLAEARKSKSSKKSSSSSSTQVSKHYNGGTTSHQTTSDNTTTTTSTTTTSNNYNYQPRQVISMPLYSAVTLRKAGVRTCPSKHCTIIKHLAKGEKVSWSVSENGFVNVQDTPYWVISLDLK